MTIGSLFPSRASILLTLATFLSVATLFVIPANAQDHPDRIAQPGVPQGKVTSGQFTESQIFPEITASMFRLNIVKISQPI
jgi:hypothetical protein